MNKRYMVYERPRVLGSVSVEAEETFLTGSIVSKVKDVKTTGQEVDGFFDMESSSTFNTSWGD